MSGLNERDRESLNLRIDDLLDSWARGQGWPDDAIDSVVEQIVARHVTAALTEAADQIASRRQEAVSRQPYEPSPSDLTEADRSGWLDGLSSATRIVRNAIPPP